jgi:hypothetical protein
MMQLQLDQSTYRWTGFEALRIDATHILQKTHELTSSLVWTLLDHYHSASGVHLLGDAYKVLKGSATSASLIQKAMVPLDLAWH